MRYLFLELRAVHWPVTGFVGFAENHYENLGYLLDSSYRIECLNMRRLYFSCVGSRLVSVRCISNCCRLFLDCASIFSVQTLFGSFWGWAASARFFVRCSAIECHIFLQWRHVPWYFGGRLSSDDWSFRSRLVSLFVFGDI